MKWKIFMMLCVSTIIVSFPQNIIGCGPGIDPYDYYTSFLILIFLKILISVHFIIQVILFYMMKQNL